MLLQMLLGTAQMSAWYTGFHTVKSVYRVTIPRLIILCVLPCSSCYMPCKHLVQYSTAQRTITDGCSLSTTGHIDRPLCLTMWQALLLMHTGLFILKVWLVLVWLLKVFPACCPCRTLSLEAGVLENFLTTCEPLGSTILVSSYNAKWPVESMIHLKLNIKKPAVVAHSWLY